MEKRIANLFGATGGNYAGNVYDTDFDSPTLNTCSGGYRMPLIIKSDRGKDMKMRLRKLTDKECWRLMGFSDEDYEKARACNSKTQMYKQAGNSLVVDVMKAIFKQML